MCQSRVFPIAYMRVRSCSRKIGCVQAGTSANSITDNHAITLHERVIIILWRKATRLHPLEHVALLFIWLPLSNLHSLRAVLLF